ncbi:MAG: hypothetical protein HC781_20490 [Leptolyngbyaceae cyanobacterium CSU_1_4]|nr:hypothetical protein [Leptolyngbyaceae cyanobacterium CSU_1_4]
MKTVKPFVGVMSVQEANTPLNAQELDNLQSGLRRSKRPIYRSNNLLGMEREILIRPEQPSSLHLWEAEREMGSASADYSRGELAGINRSAHGFPALGKSL